MCKNYAWRREDDEALRHDLEWISNELLLLTKREISIIISEYEKQVLMGGISIKEYNKFMELLGEHS